MLARGGFRSIKRFHCRDFLKGSEDPHRVGIGLDGMFWIQDLLSLNILNNLFKLLPHNEARASTSAPWRRHMTPLCLVLG